MLIINAVKITTIILLFNPKLCKADLLFKFPIYSITENLSPLRNTDSESFSIISERICKTMEIKSEGLVMYVERDVEIMYLYIAFCHTEYLGVFLLQIYAHIRRTYLDPFTCLFFSQLSLSHVSCHLYGAAIVLWTAITVEESRSIKVRLFPYPSGYYTPPFFLFLHSFARIMNRYFEFLAL